VLSSQQVNENHPTTSFSWSSPFACCTNRSIVTRFRQITRRSLRRQHRKIKPTSLESLSLGGRRCNQPHRIDDERDHPLDFLAGPRLEVTACRAQTPAGRSQTPGRL
jgi:hypothetical protein